MGAVGAKYTSGLINKPSSEAEKYTVFDDKGGARKWFANKDLSNYTEWRESLTPSEEEAISKYTGNSYGTMNISLYNTPWDELSDYGKQRIMQLYDALSRFDLKHGINVTRQTDTQIFGDYGMSMEEIVASLEKSNGYIQNDGFLSFSADPRGRSIAGSGVVLHLQEIGRAHV